MIVCCNSVDFSEVRYLRAQSILSFEKCWDLKRHLKHQNKREVDDAEEFASVQQCMVSLEFTDADMESVFKVVAACLHLGNMTSAASGGVG